MIKLKPLKIPENTLNLKDFTEFCKIQKDYDEVVELLKNHKKDIKQYCNKILLEHFIKTEEEWKEILSEKDIEKFNISFPIKNHLRIYFLRCLKTGKFYSLNNFYVKKLEQILDFSRIENTKIIIEIIFPGSYQEAKCYRMGYSTTHKYLYTIDLLDYSVIYEDKTVTKSILWKSNY